MFCDFCGCPLESTRAHCVSGDDCDVICLDTDARVLGGLSFRGNWAACDVCFYRITNAQWDKIADGVLSGMEGAPAEWLAWFRSNLMLLFSNLKVIQ